MSFDQSAVMQKAMKFADQATAEDKAKNYEVAGQAYMAAAEWLLHIIKYGTMNKETKKTLRNKIDTYIKRAEQIKGPSEKEPLKKEPVVENGAHGGKIKSGKENDETDTGPEEAAMMAKLNGSIVTNPNVTFDDVVGLQQAKIALREAVILPVKFPKLFQDARKPWAGILLYGPPGTGKSHLAKAIASECKNTFISVSSADLLSKYVGESEKGVKCLFKLARKQQPCVIFIDEIDALCSQRNETESESSRRVKNEFLVQMDGVGKDNTGVLILGATNIPWSLDSGIRRRFEKRIFIPLPEIDERESMFKMYLGAKTHHTIKEHEWKQLAENSERYSGADIRLVCREALFRPIRRLSTATHFKRVQGQKPDDPDQMWLVCSPGDPSAQPLTLDKIDPDELMEPPADIEDMLAALVTQKSAIGEADLAKFEQFTQKFGEDGS